MRYSINFDKIVNQLVPYYLGGRKLILFLQSCVKPLQSVNDNFAEYAKETRIEAAMTSQVFKLEWFLNRKFKKYFDDPQSLITIKNGQVLGIPAYYQSAKDVPDDGQLKLWLQSEKSEDREDVALYHNNEQTLDSSYSFLVCVPKLFQAKDIEGNPNGQLIDGISVDEFKAMMSYWIDKYKLSGKTYAIIINLV